MESLFLQNFLDKVRPEEKLFDNFYQAVKGGTNKLMQNVVSEAMTLDDSWINTVGAALFSVELIIKNPKKFIAEEESVIEVERAKRFSPKTVRHLASNTKNISSIDADGSVVPRKVLTFDMKEEMGIYENRFVCTLIHRVFSFIESRCRDIKSKMHIYNLTNINMDSKFNYGSAEISYKMQMSVKEPPHDRAQLERNLELLNRVNAIRKRLRRILSTDFVKKMSVLKPIKPPIIKTNIIKMNVDYQNCYKLWLFVSSYTFVGYSIEVKDKILPFDGDYFDDMTVLAALSAKALTLNSEIRSSLYENIPFSTPVEKEFEVVDTFEYEPSFIDEKKNVSNEVVNEFYFDRMKRALEVATNLDENSVINENELQMTFGKFFKSIAHINNEMYMDVIKRQSNALGLLKKSVVQRKTDELSKQEELLNRYKLLNKLKYDDLEKTLKLESKQLEKIDMLKASIEKAKAQEIEKELERKSKIAKEKALARQKEMDKKAKIAEALEKKKAEKLAQKQELARIAKEKEQAKIAQAKEKERLAHERELAKVARDEKKAQALQEKELAKVAREKEKARLAREKELATSQKVVEPSSAPVNKIVKEVQVFSTHEKSSKRARTVDLAEHAGQEKEGNEIFAKNIQE